MIIFLDSSACKDFYPNNQAADFTICLPKQLKFDSKHKVALKQYIIPPLEMSENSASIYIHASFVKHSINSNTEERLLSLVPATSKTVSSWERIQSPLYFTISEPILQTIRISLRNSKGELIKFQNKYSSILVLEIIKD